VLEDVGLSSVIVYNELKYRLLFVSKRKETQIMHGHWSYVSKGCQNHALQLDL